MPILERVGEVAAQACGLDNQRAIVVGVSGGADSLCMLDILHRSGYLLLVAHFNHQLRPESGTDADQVARIARAMNLPFICASGNVTGFSEEEGLSIEEAARMLRYRFLFEQARTYDAQAVAVGHTADDQVETVLMHLLRGSGLAGLRGMSYRCVIPIWDKSIPVVRPLLDTWREETHRYCIDQQLFPVEDASNKDDTYFRNRLRHQLIPILESYNPQWRQVMLRTSRVLAGDFAIVESETERNWAKLTTIGEDYVVIDRKAFLSSLPGMQRNLIRRAAGLLCPGIRDFDMETVDRTIAFAQTAPKNRRLEIVGALQLYMDGKWLYILVPNAMLPGENWPQIPPSFHTELSLPGEVFLSGRWSIRTEVYPVSDLDVETFRRNVSMAGLDHQSQDNSSIGWNNDAWVDAETVCLPLVVRRHRSGERWSPLGMSSGSVKLSDFFINNRLPQPARAGWPLVCSGEDVVWLPGFRPGQAFRVREGTQRVIHLRMEERMKDEGCRKG